MRCLVALSLLCILAASGCYRTHYLNFSPQNPDRGVQHLPVKERGWQHFFIWGWVPGERKIDAREICGGEEHIESIRTRRTFVEGLVAAFAGYYINIYSPYDGAVYCTEKPEPK